MTSLASVTTASTMEVINVPPLPLMSDTEDALLEESSELDDPETLDLSSHGLTKLSRAAPGYDLTTLTLLLDNNSLQRLDNIHTYQCLEKLSACNNELVRMSQVSKLNHLKILNLSNNNIELMDGLKELKLLSWLGLANNKIKSIQQLNQCVHLEHLDLSGNFIQHLSDISYLKNLKVLLLHRNNVETLRGCDRFFPSGISTLTLNGNDLTDLTELSFLTGLIALEQLTLADNPCILQPEEESKQFDYRPYVINWCLGLRVLDGVIVGAKESLKAEWMYSQSKGRHFNVGQHDDLLVYLLSICPLHPGEDWEEDKKLNLILSKVQEHQQSLREPGSGAMSPRCNTLTRSMVSSPMRGNSRKTSAASSASTTPTATPLAPRRSSFTFAQQQRTLSGIRRSSLSRTSPSPVRRRTMTPGRIGGMALKHATPPPPPASYALALPRTLYGDDINGNNNNMMMTQSMDPAHLAARLDNNTTPTVLTHRDASVNQADLMTASLDPTILRQLEPVQMKGLPEAWSKESPPVMTSNVSRPNSLFQQAEAAQSNLGQDLKDLYLQDLSDGELAGQSLMYTRLQTRLNPVPESLNSPDMAPLNMTGRPPAKDDPIRVYNRDLAISSSTVSTTSSSSASKQIKAQPNLPTSKKDENGYSSSSDDHPPPTTSMSTTTATSTTTTSVAASVTSKTPTKVSQQIKKEQTPKKLLSKPKATPTKIRPPPPSINNKNLQKPEARKKSLPPSDTSRLSRNASKDDRTDNGEEESSQSEAEQQKLQRVRKSRKARANSSSSRRPSNENVNNSRGKYAPEKYSDTKKQENNSSAKRPSSATNISRPRSNTLTTPQGSSKTDVKSPRAHSAALTVQKSWRGHSAKDRDAERVNQLKEEVRNLRTEEHVKHLTKELANAKQALERERKLRALQMDAIKVLWKEVQLMDEARTGPSAINTNENEITRPSGRGGSKISSRSSEHSIAKLMETLHATAGITPSPSLQTLKNQENSDLVSMAQSMPASVLGGQLNEVHAVEALSKTCNSLQSQVEQLQSSLVGVMQFMSNFQHLQDQPQGVYQPRNRHSSNESSSFSYFQPIQGQMAQSVGPTSLPISSLQRPTTVLIKQDSTECSNSAGLAMSRSCDCLTQTDISAVLTPRNEQMPPDPPAAQFLHFKRVDISLETSDSEATSSGVKPSQEHQSRLLQQESNSKERSRSKSPRPQTLPGLVKASDKERSNSPQAPQPVKNFAMNLIEGIIGDTISRALSDNDEKNNEETDVSLSLATEETKDVEEDLPASGIEVRATSNVKSPSSHVETDSLDESEHAGQHS